MRIAFLWHMHQPDYRVAGRFQRPWVYLHALAGYTDMATALEAVPAAHAVVNFTPVLLDQLDDYARRLKLWRDTGTPPRDPLLDALIWLPPSGPGRAELVRTCLPVTRNRRTDRDAAFGKIVDELCGADAASIPDGLCVDLLVWHHLSWLGETLRGGDPRAAELLRRGGDFTLADRRSLLDLIAEGVAAVIPRWRALAKRGSVELSTTPYYHPLLPLLLDFSSACDTAPGTAVPRRPYPGGAQRARWHLQEGLARCEQLLGQRPTGCWPSEAALSEATLPLLAEAGFSWTASSQSVLNASAGHAGKSGADPFRVYRRAGEATACVFRNDGLSDRIGFAYKDWTAEDAVGDLIVHLENIAREPGRDLVLIALDGENPWEYYPQNGLPFLRELYGQLSSHPSLKLTTLGDCVVQLPAEPLPPVRAGSWVHGQLLTWIGHPEKNRAWELLIAAKEALDRSGRSELVLLHRLGACEGSDWFWWPGAHNPAPSVADFDALFRAQLSALYSQLGIEPPPILARPFAHGVSHAVEAGGTMRPTEQ